MENIRHIHAHRHSHVLPEHESMHYIFPMRRSRNFKREKEKKKKKERKNEPTSGWTKPFWKKYICGLFGRT